MRDELDRYYTPPTLARAVVDRVCRSWDVGPEDLILEPSSGGGAFVDALEARGLRNVVTVDVDRGARQGARHHVGDFLAWETSDRFSLIIGNPPFGEAQEHVTRALSLLAPDGMLAFLLPLHFWCSMERAVWWESASPSSIAAVRPRPEFRVDGGDMREIALFVWFADELTGSPVLGHLDWAKPSRSVQRAIAAERTGQLPLLGQGFADARQTSIFDAIGGAA